MDQNLVNQLAADLARLQRILGKFPLDYKIRDDHKELLKEFANCAGEAEQKAALLAFTPLSTTSQPES